MGDEACIITQRYVFSRYAGCFVMNCTLHEKLSNVGRQLDGAIDSYEKLRVPLTSVTTKGDRILKKWKYRPCKLKRNRFILHGRHLSYENMVVKARRGFPGFNLHSYEDLMSRCSRIEAGTQSQWLDWDAEWLNPLQLSSKGWDFESLNSGNLVCKCANCKSTLCLKLNSGPSLNRRYGERYVSSEHSEHCPWRERQFDLRNEYHLQPWNLIREIERIKHLGTSRATIATIPRDKLQILFKCDEESLNLFLQGFRYLQDDIVECAGCFRKAFKSKILQQGVNAHSSWCKYYDREKLSNMIRKELEFPKEENLASRLKILEKYFESV
ncbi:uncharacterized protein ZBIST_4619 [Zygosaccharomyces bailii]|nr:uncharacterized protein ZBIST_4619 [Zygosaccharomyces bailii]